MAKFCGRRLGMAPYFMIPLITAISIFLKQLFDVRTFTNHFPRSGTSEISDRKLK